MTKLELINALIQSGDIEHVLTRLTERLEQVDSGWYSSNDIIAEANDILKELEDAKIPVYVASSDEPKSKHKGTRIMRVEQEEETLCPILIILNHLVKWPHSLL